MKISEVLHLAADKYLAANAHEYYHSVRKEKYSCCAIDAKTNEQYAIIKAGLRNMGCDTGSGTLFVKHGDPRPGQVGINEDVQGMRYFWLKWAALMAEEQGQ